MKNFINIFLLASALIVASCDTDPCRDVTCGTYGTCSEGTCTCEAGYEQDTDGLCNTEQRAKFIAGYNLSETCDSGTDNYSVTIATSSQGIMKINVTGLYGAARTVSVDVSSDGSQFTIPENTPYGTGTIQGTGTYNTADMTVTVNYAFTDALGSVDNCTATLTRL